MDYLLNEQGIYGDKKEAQKLYEQARGWLVTLLELRDSHHHDEEVCALLTPFVPNASTAVVVCWQVTAPLGECTVQLRAR
jgi:hypothetical protein